MMRSRGRTEEVQLNYTFHYILNPLLRRRHLQTLRTRRVAAAALLISEPVAVLPVAAFVPTVSGD